MSLSQSQALTNVHPALAERIRYMDAVIDFWGGKQVYISGVRDRQKQEDLFNTTRGRPVAPPGCSQHQYGFAVDVLWLPIFNFAANVQLSTGRTNEIMEQLGRMLGLTTVAGDTGHFQVFAGSLFRDWAVRSGFCDPFQVPKPRGISELICGFGATSSGIDATGRIICFDEFDDILTS